MNAVEAVLRFQGFHIAANALHTLSTSVLAAPPLANSLVS